MFKAFSFKFLFHNIRIIKIIRKEIFIHEEDKKKEEPNCGQHANEKKKDTSGENE